VAWPRRWPPEAPAKVGMALVQRAGRVRGMVMGTRSPLAASVADACWTRAWRGVSDEW
jgi:hypothetical protein